MGFANLPNQVFRKSVKRGFEFTLMVVGESHATIFVFSGVQSARLPVYGVFEMLPRKRGKSMGLDFATEAK